MTTPASTAALWSYVAAAAPLIGILCGVATAKANRGTDQYTALGGLGYGLFVLAGVCAVGAVAAAVAWTRQERPAWIWMLAGAINVLLMIPAIIIAALKDWD